MKSAAYGFITSASDCLSLLGGGGGERDSENEASCCQIVCCVLNCVCVGGWGGWGVHVCTPLTIN